MNISICFTDVKFSPSTTNFFLIQKPVNWFVAQNLLTGFYRWKYYSLMGWILSLLLLTSDKLCCLVDKMFMKICQTKLKQIFKILIRMLVQDRSSPINEQRKSQINNRRGQCLVFSKKSHPIICNLIWKRKTKWRLQWPFKVENMMKVRNSTESIFPADEFFNSNSAFNNGFLCMQSRKLNKDREHFEGTKQMLRIGILVQPFLDNILFYTPWKHQKTKGFFSFLEGMKWKIGQKWVDLFAQPLWKKCPYSGFFWSVFPHIQTEYGLKNLRIRTRSKCFCNTWRYWDERGMWEVW